jgi:hypothetical protein
VKLVSDLAEKVITVSVEDNDDLDDLHHIPDEDIELDQDIENPEWTVTEVGFKSSAENFGKHKHSIVTLSIEIERITGYYV